MCVWLQVVFLAVILPWQSGLCAEEETEEEVCFGRLGCFDTQSPWRSVLRPFPNPSAPDVISTRVYFYSRPNVHQRHYLTLAPNVSLGDAPFDGSKTTVLVTHGFASNGNASWMDDLKTAYLKNVDANVLIVDWGQGAQLWNYLQVASNTRVVGKELALLVRHLVDERGSSPDRFHLIGHSLGAQISSYVGKAVPGIGRLTALDPAQPGFEGFDKAVRLDKEDAVFVDVVHTDARPLIPTLGFGMITPHGHVDFYMNGGFDQPGCIIPKKLPEVTNLLDLAKYTVEVIGEAVACPHGRAYEYLAEAFNDTECVFWGHKASAPAVVRTVANTVTQGRFHKFVALSSSCSKQDCTPVGYGTWQSPLRGSFVVTTKGSGPFCISEPGIPAESDPASKPRDSLLGEAITKAVGLFKLFMPH